MKLIILAAIVIVTASSALANPCKAFHDLCVAKGVTKGGGHMFTCEKKAATKAHNKACLTSLRKHKAKQPGA